MEETNRFTVTTHLRSRLKEDEEDKEEIKAEMDLAVPTTRVRKKSSLRQLDGPPPPKKHVTWDLRDEICLRPIRVTTDIDLEYAYLTESQVTTLEGRGWTLIPEIPDMTFEKVQAVRAVAFVLWKRRHELKRATEELVLEERITEA